MRKIFFQIVAQRKRLETVCSKGRGEWRCTRRGHLVVQLHCNWVTHPKRWQSLTGCVYFWPPRVALLMRCHCFLWLADEHSLAKADTIRLHSTVTLAVGFLLPFFFYPSIILFLNSSPWLFFFPLSCFSIPTDDDDDVCVVCRHEKCMQKPSISPFPSEKF